MREVQYRTETFGGSQQRLAEEVMAFEIFTLGNTDILYTLAEGLLKGRGAITERCWDFVDELNNNGFVDDMGTYDQLEFCKALLTEVEKVTGVHVQYALWLADKDVVTDPKVYGRAVRDEYDFDSYEIGPVVLSDLASSGKLYGYTEEPVCLEDQYEELRNEMTDIINEQEDDDIDYRRALWLDERYSEVDSKLFEIRKILDAKGPIKNYKRPLTVKIQSAQTRIGAPNTTPGAPVKETEPDR